MTLGDRARIEREAKGWSQAEVARRVSHLLRRKISQVAIHHIEKRGNVEPRFAVELASVLGVSLEWLRKGRGVKDLEPLKNLSRSAIIRTEIGEKEPHQWRDREMPPLVLYRTVRGDRDQTGGFMLHAKAVGEVDRPNFLISNEKAFSIRVLDNTHAPVYRARDILLVDPEDAAVEGDDCIFTADLDADGAFTVIGCLKKITPEQWITRQQGQSDDCPLSRKEFPHAWPIVGVYRRR